MPQESQIERTFKEFFSLTSNALKSVNESLKDADIPEPPKPRKREVRVPPALRTPFDGNVLN